jgi:DNA-binding MarR family transcriptional regulator
MIIARSPTNGGVRVADVAGRLNVTGAFVTNEVKKLVKAHLIVKRSNPEDGREVLLSLSPSGLERVKAIEADLLMVNDRLFGNLSREDFQHLARTVGSLVNVFGQTVGVLKALSATAGPGEKVEPVGRKKTRTKQGS